jgi:hypothetical protein
MKLEPRNKFSNFRHYAGFCFTALLLSFILTSARFVKTDFGGEWTLSKGKSKLAVGQMRMVFDQLKVTQINNEINISRISQAPDGQELIMEEKIYLDGKESENIFFDGAVKKKSTTKWSTDEKTMTISSTFTFNRHGKEVIIKSTESWEIARGLGELTIKYTSSGPSGEVKDIYVFNKK